MKEFMMIFRSEATPDYQPTQEEMQSTIREWQDWIGGIAAQGKFVDTKRLAYEGGVVNTSGSFTDGPYTELKEIVGGYLIANCENLEEAQQIAKDCPTLKIGGNVEVREIMEIPSDVQKMLEAEKN